MPTRKKLPVARRKGKTARKKKQVLLPGVTCREIDTAAIPMEVLNRAPFGTNLPYHLCASEVASLVVQKQEAYGDSFGKSGDIMRVLYPDGIPPEKMNDALTVVRVVDKLFRIASDRDAFGEDPWKDIMGYALLAVVKGETRKQEPKSGVGQAGPPPPFHYNCRSFTDPRTAPKRKRTTGGRNAAKRKKKK